MKTAGIIVEYNPFHNGHQYHIERTRQETGADFIIAVMSGDFVQRGEPALTDKHARTRMALLGGADLVLELPVMFATGSAGDFASGAVSLLDKLGVVDALCFGSEAGSIEPLKKAAALLSDEPPAFQALLQENLRSGHSFPLARSMALKNCLSLQQHSDAGHGSSAPGISPTAVIEQPGAKNISALPADDFLSAPNNILGIEYCLSLHKRKSSIRPVTIRRQGAGYHDDAICDSAISAPGGSSLSFSSATAIRRALMETGRFEQDALALALPAGQLSLWQDIISKGRLLFAQDLTKELRCRLILEEAEGFTQYADVSRELSDKLRKNYLSFTDWNALCEALKSKEMTYSRISRALCHILLSITHSQLLHARTHDYVPYARMLGFQKSAEPLLSAIKKNSSVPLVSKLADARRLLDADALFMLQQDIAAAHVYESAVAAKSRSIPQNEYSRQICIL